MGQPTNKGEVVEVPVAVLFYTAGMVVGLSTSTKEASKASLNSPLQVLKFGKLLICYGMTDGPARDTSFHRSSFIVIQTNKYQVDKLILFSVLLSEIHPSATHMSQIWTPVIHDS